MCTNEMPVRTLLAAKDRVVFSLGGTAPAENSVFVFWPENATAVAPLLEEVRATVKVENAQTDLTTEAVFQISNDGNSWGDGSTPGGFISLESPVTGASLRTTAWFTDTSKFVRFIRFGIVAGQSSGSTAAFGRVTMSVDLVTR